MTPTLITLEQSDGIATLAFNRPPVNAIDLQFVQEAGECLARLATDDDVRALIITGSGACFSAGLDLKSVPLYGPAEQRAMVCGINRAAGGLYRLAIPTVAAVNGHAIAGGLVLALACDYRVGTTAACKIGLTEARAGIPFPAVAMAVVKAELAPAVARRTTLLARNIDSEAALACGILDELQPPARVLARAREVALDLASAPRTAYARVKHQLRAETDALIDRLLASDSDPMLDSWLADDTRAAASALLTGAK